MVRSFVVFSSSRFRLPFLIPLFLSISCVVPGIRSDLCVNIYTVYSTPYSFPIIVIIIIFGSSIIFSGSLNFSLLFIPTFKCIRKKKRFKNRKEHLAYACSYNTILLFLLYSLSMKIQQDETRDKTPKDKTRHPFLRSLHLYTHEQEKVKETFLISSFHRKFTFFCEKKKSFISVEYEIIYK